LNQDQLRQFNPTGEDLYTAEEAMIAYERFKQNKALIEWIPTVINSKRSNVFFDTGAQNRAKELLADIRE
jgi:hypothetical protein